MTGKRRNDLTASIVELPELLKPQIASSSPRELRIGAVHKTTSLGGSWHFTAIFQGSGHRHTRALLQTPACITPQRGTALLLSGSNMSSMWAHICRQPARPTLPIFFVYRARITQEMARYCTIR